MKLLPSTEISTVKQVLMVAHTAHLLHYRRAPIITALPAPADGIFKLTSAEDSTDESATLIIQALGDLAVIQTPAAERIAYPLIVRLLSPDLAVLIDLRQASDYSMEVSDEKGRAVAADSAVQAHLGTLAGLIRPLITAH